jgi:hypothetical protein
MPDTVHTHQVRPGAKSVPVCAECGAPITRVQGLDSKVWIHDVDPHPFTVAHDVERAAAHDAARVSDALFCPMRACDSLSAANGRLYAGRRMCAEHTADFDRYDGSL